MDSGYGAGLRLARENRLSQARRLPAVALALGLVRRRQAMRTPAVGPERRLQRPLGVPRQALAFATNAIDLVDERLNPIRPKVLACHLTLLWSKRRAAATAYRSGSSSWEAGPSSTSVQKCSHAPHDSSVTPFPALITRSALINPIFPQRGHVRRTVISVFLWQSSGHTSGAFFSNARRGAHTKYVKEFTRKARP